MWGDANPSPSHISRSGRGGSDWFKLDRRRFGLPWTTPHGGELQPKVQPSNDQHAGTARPAARQSTRYAAIVLAPDCRRRQRSSLCSLVAMKATPPWWARAWLPYSLAGIGWVMMGALVLGNPRGLGLIFIGLSCLSLGLGGALWRIRHGHGLARNYSPGR